MCPRDEKGCPFHIGGYHKGRLRDIYTDSIYAREGEFEIKLV